MGEAPEERGVHNPRVVDLIELDPESDEVVLFMLEQRPWEADPVRMRAQIAQVEAKFNAYLSYVQSGSLARDYPQYVGKVVRLRLDCAEPPRGEAVAFLKGMESFAEGERLRFECRVTAA